MKKIYVLFCVIGLFLSYQADAQQNPQYTQYMYNMNVINPAYAGSKESLSVGMLYREQWQGIDGAPTTGTFHAHTPIGGNVGVGISAINDRIGPTDLTDLMADISYTIDFQNDWKLAFGVKVGATFNDIGLANVRTQNPNDPAFANNISETHGIFGAGFFLYNNNFYVGLSVPNFLESRHFTEQGIEWGNQARHFFGTAGYVWEVTDNLKIKPSVFARSVFSEVGNGDQFSWDANLNFLFMDRFELGASYRVDDAFSFLAGVKPTPWWHIGFAYDATTSDLNRPSYEVFMIFDIFFKKKTYLSPRYF